MLILYDFKCEDCGKVVEDLVLRDTDAIACSCGDTAYRVISPVRCKLEGHSGHFPTAASKWERQHEKAGREPSETDPSGW